MRSSVPLVLALLVSLAPASASADDDGGDELLLFVIGTAAVGAIDLVFLTTDAIYGAQGELLPPAAAWVQLFLASMANYAMGVATLFLTTKTAGTALGIAELGLGTWFAWHAIHSLDSAEEDRSPTALSIAPRADGLSASLTHAF